MATWNDLREELNRWCDADHPATLWWRDDDAADSTAQADRLLRLADESGLPLHLAVIPAQQSESLVARLQNAPATWVLQHGYAHINHAPIREPESELETHRPKAIVLQELRRGFELLKARHGAGFLPVLVPPWNRVATEFLPDLPAIGFRGVSCFSARQKPTLAPGLLAINTHCEPTKWKKKPMWKKRARFSGTDAALSEITGHLSARRLGQAGASEPTGLLTHHLDMDEETWAFVEQLIERTVAHPGAKWIEIERLL